MTGQYILIVSTQFNICLYLHCHSPTSSWKVNLHMEQIEIHKGGTKESYERKIFFIINLKS